MTLQRIIWLASFPKSGNTWVRLLLANYFLADEAPIGINRVDRFSAGDVGARFFRQAAGPQFRGETLAEWLSARPQALRLLAASKPQPHFVKTHCQVGRVNGKLLIPPEVTAGAIYIYRNPFDVAVSYARHMGRDIDHAIARMADPKALNKAPKGMFEPVGRWDAHIESWLSARGLWLHAMRYEDMVADTERAMRGLIGFLKAPIDDARLRRSVEASRFESLQRQEAEHGFKERPATMDQFFASGRNGGWRNVLTKAQIGRLRAAFAPALERYYPELMSETAATGSPA